MRYILIMVLVFFPFTIFADLPDYCTSNCHADTTLYVLLRNLEGFSPFIYDDTVGYQTVCFGHKMVAGESFPQPLTGEDCQRILENDVAKAEKQVNSLVKVPLQQNQHDSLTSLVFNIGARDIKRSTLLQKVNAGKHAEVPAQIMRFVYAGGKKEKGLIIRRRVEASLYANKKFYMSKN
jgi:lysozyme